MKTINEKYEAWVAKGCTDSPNILLLTRSEGKWYLIGNKRSDEVQLLTITVDDGTGLRPEYTYSVGHPDAGNPCAGLVLKDEKKLIAQRQGDFIGFGIKGIHPSLKAMLVYLRTTHLHSFIFCSCQANAVMTVLALADAPQDAVTCYMQNMLGLSSVETAGAEGGKHSE